ncbi:MAG: Antioxidant, AhpC/TSA family [Candidatus Magasanikbacteria bacterium GW2011_GWD2_43_18]|nr:MAG: Antioxidant, AhpC/TSA family [Candidatus Magasanikbacteria bacterium GW2011_GWC2_42_27]KKT04122.1 MAG: Antioxidant, AhpC/TSA family [Candidatus Magasanikbacteria bacterium GW2011_GWD2_43_18]KKT25699.1 MAG: Antioxidant, AhpC/TSA family [Candidatus Magasanikbacteria bacterium GW2011_GWA2_43_9]HBB38519.1 thioredoxin-dependent thiol peroxidase [Candidatus Magasanikbacteria bacterium]HCC13935.1 thioredoxin-dependent thiol peroxidase [Candidatus Magasanikbacteria bacterium]
MLKQNSPAPPFSLPDQNGKMQSLTDYSGKKVLLYFYPKDDTPGCTTEACNFRDRLNELKDHGVQVLGVSKDTIASHKKFSEKFDLNFPLLSDENGTLVKAYGVWKEKSMYGKTYMGISRESFLIDEEGNLVKHYEKVKPEEHVEEVLRDVEA